MQKKTPPPPPPPKRDIREMSEAEIAELEAWLIELMKGRPMEQRSPLDPSELRGMFSEMPQICQEVFDGPELV